MTAIRERRRHDLRAAFDEVAADFASAGLDAALVASWALACVAAERDADDEEVAAALAEAADGAGVVAAPGCDA